MAGLGENRMYNSLCSVQTSSAKRTTGAKSLPYALLYILWLDIAASDIQTQNICLVETRSTKVTLSELILLEVAELSSHKSIMARHYRK